MRISDKEWKNIEFRKNKFRELESALDQAVSGRDNKVSSFLLGCLADGETGKAAAVEKLVNELVKSTRKEGKKQSNTNQRAVGLNMAFNGVYTNRYTNSLEVELL